MTDVSLNGSPDTQVQPRSTKKIFPLSEGKAIAMVGLSAILYGFLGYFGIQLLVNNFSLSSMLFWRFLVATLWMVLFGLVQYQKATAKPLKFQSLIKPFVLGALFYSGGAVFFFMACRYTGTGLAMVIFFSYPIFVALLSWFRNYKAINRYTVISLIAISLGLILLKGEESNPLSFLGILFALSAALCYAIYVFSSKKILSQVSSSVFTTLVCGSCSLVFLVLALSSGEFSWPQSWNTWGYTLALGVLATALPIQLLVKGMQVTGAIKASIISVLEPVVTLGVGITLLGELISNQQIVGVFIVIAGAIIVQFAKG